MNQRMFGEGHCQVGFNPSGSQRDVVGIPSRIQANTKVFTRLKTWKGDTVKCVSTTATEITSVASRAGSVVFSLLPLFYSLS